MSMIQNRDLTTDAIEQAVEALAPHCGESFARHVCEQLAQRVAQDTRARVLLSIMTSGQAAAALGVTRQWVKELARRHELGWHAGYDWLFLPEEVETMRGLLRR